MRCGAVSRSRAEPDRRMAPCGPLDSRDRAPRDRSVAALVGRGHGDLDHGMAPCGPLYFRYRAPRDRLGCGAAGARSRRTRSRDGSLRSALFPRSGSPRPLGLRCSWGCGHGDPDRGMAPCGPLYSRHRAPRDRLVAALVGRGHGDPDHGMAPCGPLYSRYRAPRDRLGAVRRVVGRSGPFPVAAGGAPGRANDYFVPYPLLYACRFAKIRHPLRAVAFGAPRNSNKSKSY